MKETPIIFKAEMVRAILDGRKTQTRRIVKLKDGEFIDGNHIAYDRISNGVSYNEKRYPFGKVGDRLWVRETWSQIPEMKPSGYFSNPKWVNRVAWYAADCDKPTWGGKWRPSIHMPRWASRINLEITGIKVERLQDISEADAMAEGCERLQLGPSELNGMRVHPMTSSYKDAFQSLWQSINGSDSWSQNPFVWCVSFKQIKEL